MSSNWRFKVMCGARAMELAIGEVASLTGLPVKTIRFYSDEGLLPTAARTSGGHRRYGREHLARLELIRALRALDVDLPTIAGLLDDRREIGEVLAAQRQIVAAQLRRLRRREIILAAVETDPTRDLLVRLPALSRLEAVERNHLLEDFWSRVLDGTRGDPEIQAVFRGVTVPDLPDDADVTTVADFLELVELVTDDDFVAAARHSATWLFDAAQGPVDVTRLMAGVQAASELAGAEDDGRIPDAAVDALVGAYADALDRPADLAFRRWLLDQHERASHPHFARFWELVARLGNATPDPARQRFAASMQALLDGLRHQVEDAE